MSGTILLKNKIELELITKLSEIIYLALTFLINEEGVQNIFHEKELGGGQVFSLLHEKERGGGMG